MASTSKKRKRTVLSIEQKLDILKKIDWGSSLASIAEEFEVGKTTVYDLKVSRQKIMKFVTETQDERCLKKRCIVRKADDDAFDKAVHFWFVQERHKGTPISGVVLMEKAKLLYQQMYPDKTGEDFKASKGWLHRFKNRHGIRQLTMQGESLSADTSAADDFKLSFSRFVEEESFSLHQVFNADETGLYWRLLPNKTLADGTEKTAKNMKTSKDRVTLMATGNASGDFRLPLVFIHKSAKPRCFSGINMSALPVHYYAQKKAWMDQAIFSDWFFKHFVPEVRRYLESKYLDPKAVLLLDNAPSHPSASALITSDGKIKCFFLPPNVTSILQPMDQGVLENLKRRYKREFLRDLLLRSSEEISFMDFAKKLTIKEAVYFSAKSWNEVPSSALSRAWNKVGLGPSSFSEEEVPTPQTVDISEECVQLGIDSLESEVWLDMDLGESGVDEMNDEQIISMALGEDSSDHEKQENQVAVPTVTHAEADIAFSTGISWLEQQHEATPMNLMLLHNLQTLATSKKFCSLKQKSITDYFKPA